MSAAHWIIGGAVVGVGFLWWRNRQAEEEAKKKQEEQGDLGDAACAVLKAAGLPVPDGCGSIVNTIIGGAKKLADEVFYSDADRVKDLAAANAKNNALNGEAELEGGALLNSNIDIASAYSSALNSEVLKYKNGCTPFAGSPGWSACAPGTIDMWGHTGNARAEVRSTRARQPDAEPFSSFDDDYALAHPGNLLSGSTRKDSADVATKGPLPYRAADGSIVNRYLVRGVKVECPQGQAPALWDELGNPIGDNRGVPPCAPNGVSSYQVNWTGPTRADGSAATGSDDSLEAGAVIDCASVDLTQFTWDRTLNSGTGAWRRLRVGETSNPGPCASSATPVKTSVEIGTFAVRMSERTRTL